MDFSERPLFQKTLFPIPVLGLAKRFFPDGSPAGYAARKVHVYVVLSPLTTQGVEFFKAKKKP